jgi:hypothetical protein
MNFENYITELTLERNKLKEQVGQLTLLKETVKAFAAGIEQGKFGAAHVDWKILRELTRLIDSFPTAAQKAVSEDCATTIIK